MRAVIFLSGEPYRGEIDVRGALVVAADGGYRDCAARGIVPDEVVGDFDSLGFVPEGARIVPVEKDFTDCELAAAVASERGADEFVFYGGGGGREDHFLGNLEVLYSLAKAGKRAEMITNRSRIVMTDSGAEFDVAPGVSVSIAPFGGTAHIMDTEGLKYPARDLTLSPGQTLGFSNRAENAHISVKLAGGVAAIFVGTAPEE